MASDAEEEQNVSAAMATPNHLQQAERGQAEADNLCSICLSEIVNAASIDGCFHRFCFNCIQQWAAKRAVCPLCMQSFDHILLSMRADDYQVYTVGSSTHQQSTAAREQARSRSLQQRYYLRPRPTNNETMAGRRRRYPGAQGDAGPRRPNTSGHQAAR